MSDLELQALIAIVNRETAATNAEVAQFGQAMCSPMTDAFRELCEEYERRSRRRKLRTAKTYDEQRALVVAIVGE